MENNSTIWEQLELDAVEHVTKSGWYKLYTTLISLVVYSYFAVGLISGFWSLVGGFLLFNLTANIVTFLMGASLGFKFGLHLPVYIFGILMRRVLNIILKPFNLSTFENAIFAQAILMTIINILVVFGVGYFLIPYIAKIFN